MTNALKAPVLLKPQHQRALAEKLRQKLAECYPAIEWSPLAPWGWGQTAQSFLGQGEEAEIRIIVSATKWIDLGYRLGVQARIGPLGDEHVYCADTDFVYLASDRRATAHLCKTGLRQVKDGLAFYRYFVSATRHDSFCLCHCHQQSMTQQDRSRCRCRR